MLSVTHIREWEYKCVIAQRSSSRKKNLYLLRSVRCCFQNTARWYVYFGWLIRSKGKMHCRGLLSVWYSGMFFFLAGRIIRNYWEVSLFQRVTFVLLNEQINKVIHHLFCYLHMNDDIRMNFIFDSLTFFFFFGNAMIMTEKYK